MNFAVEANKRFYRYEFAGVVFTVKTYRRRRMGGGQGRRNITRARSTDLAYWHVGIRIVIAVVFSESLNKTTVFYRRTDTAGVARVSYYFAAFFNEG